MPGDRGPGRARPSVPITADTFSPEVARRARRRGRGGDQRHRRRRDRSMLELVAERGCGYVLMHIEGPPRVDRAPPALRRRRSSTCRRWFARADRGARSRRGRPRSRSRSTPASTSTSASTTTSRSCAASASCARSAARCSSRSRARTSSARCWPAPGRSGCRPRSASGRPPPRRRWRSRRAPQVLRLHDAERARRDAGRGPRSPMAELASALGDAAAAAWEPALGAGRDDGRLVADERRAPRTAPSGRRSRAASHPELRRGARARPGSTRSTPTRSRRSRPRASGNVIVTSGTASGKSLSLQPAGARRDRRATPKRRALYLYPTKALAQDQARKLSRARARPACATRSTTATRRARTGRRSAAARTWS